MGYHVHKGMLAFNSTVLDDDSLFPLGILKAAHRFPRSKTVITFEFLNSLLKVSTKYAFDELRSELVEHLIDILMFPSSRADYVQDKARTILPPDYDPAIAVDFGISYHIPTITPTACFEVALWAFPKLLDVPLSRPALRACLLARDALRAAAESALDTRTLAYNPSTRMFPHGCARFAAGAVDAEGARLCAACETVLRVFDEEMKDRIWEALPSACGFRDWEAVRVAQSQAGC